MTIVELSDDVTGSHWVNIYEDNRYVADVWGIAEVEVQENDKWCITIREGNSIIGFLHADAIRRR